MSVKVVTDSSCDLPQSLVDALRIEVVPLSIRFGEEELVDRDELDANEFWSRLKTAQTLPETSAPSAGAFEARFRQLIEREATGIVSINLSSRLSATMQAAQVAANAVRDDCPTVVIDSRTVSMGLGALCLTAARRAADGARLEEIVEDVHLATAIALGCSAHSTRSSTSSAAVVSATHGRCSARCCRSSPSWRCADGVVEESGKVRTRSKALAALADRVKAQPIETCAVLHGQATDLDDLLDLLAPVFPRDEIVTGLVGPVIGTHAGPGVIGVSFQVAR